MRWGVYAAMAGAALGVAAGVAWVIEWLAGGRTGAPALAVLLIVAGAGCAGLAAVGIALARLIEAAERMERAQRGAERPVARGMTAAELEAAQRVWRA